MDANGLNVEVNENPVNIVIEYDRNKDIMGITAAEFLENAERLGWENAKEDPVFRAFCVAFDGDNQNFRDVGNVIINHNVPVNQEPEYYRRNVMESLISYFSTLQQRSEEQQKALDGLNAYKLTLGNNVVQNEEQIQNNGEMIQDENLNINQLLNNNNNNDLNQENNEIAGENVNLDENQNQENNEIENAEINVNLNQNNEEINVNEIANENVNLNQNQNNEIVNENVIQPNEEQIIQPEVQANQPEVQAVPVAKRPVKTREYMEQKGTDVINGMDDATLRLRGSDEYKNAREEFRKVQNKYKELMAHTEDGKLNEKEARSLRGDLLNVYYLIDTYLGKKMKENDSRENAKKRTEIMTAGFDLIEEQIYAMDARLEEISETPASSFENMKVKYDAALKGIKDAKLFLRGSDEFDEAADSFEKLESKFRSLERDYKGKEANITQAELDDLDRLFDEANKKIITYTSMKEGATLNDNGHKRTEAMYNARTVLTEARRRIENLTKAKEQKPAKEMKDLNTDAARNFVGIEFADRSAYFGSKEFKNAMSDYKNYMDHLKVISEEGHVPTRRELDDLGILMEKGAKSIDTYLAMKHGKDFGEVTEIRVNAMRGAKENIIETKKRYDILLNERKTALRNENPANLRTRESAVSTEVTTAKTHVNGSRVWFGGSDYDKAEQMFKDAVLHEAARDSARELQEPSRNSLRSQIAELKAAQDAARVYIERKEKEMKDSKKPLDEKGQKRLSEMRNAYDCLGVRIDMAQTKLDTFEAVDQSAMDTRMQILLDEKRAAIPGKTGFDKVLAITAADDMETMKNISRHKFLTAEDMKDVRVVLASMMLHDKFENKEFGRPNPPSVQGYGKMVTKVANSKEFMELFEKEGITQDKIKAFATQPEKLKAFGNKFVSAVAKNASQAKELQLNKNANRQLNANPRPEGPGMGGQ